MAEGQQRQRRRDVREGRDEEARRVRARLDQ